MVDIKDLRIGNIIFAPGLFHKCYAKVIMIGKQEEFRKDQIAFTALNENVNKGVKYKLGMCVSDLNEFDPIPLTEEILLNCGFELLDTEIKYSYISLPDLNNEKEYCKIYYIYGLELAVSCTGEIYTIYRCEDNYHDRTGNKIEYLHDLQNYYHIMTKKELDVNL